MYTEYYQLKEEPFRLTPDPRFVHMAEPHRLALNALLNGVTLRKGFAVVTGPVGCGKTTILHTLLELLAQRRLTKTDCSTALIVNPTLSREEFFEVLLDEFEITCNSTSKTHRLLALEKMFREVDARGGTCILLIDEAHLLSLELLEEIRLLSNVDTHTGKLLQVILTGQVELFRLLDKPEARALKQRIATRCQIRPLSLPESVVYIAERFRAAGLLGPVPFSDSAIELVHRYSQGVPRLINLVCDSCLLIGFQAQRSGIDPEIVHEAALGLDLIEVPVEVPVEVMAGRISFAPAQTLVPAKAPASTLDNLIDAMKRRLVEGPSQRRVPVQE